MSLVTQELTSVSGKWQYIGEKLGVGQSSLRHINTQYSDPGDRLREVLRVQLQSCATTWKHIVAVLRTPHIGESYLADNLEAKYSSCELAYSSVNAIYVTSRLGCLRWLAGANFPLLYMGTWPTFRRLLLCVQGKYRAALTPIQSSSIDLFNSGRSNSVRLCLTLDRAVGYHQVHEGLLWRAEPES